MGRPQPRYGRLIERLRPGLDATTDECVILDGYSGRPYVRYNGVKMPASRVVWIIAHGDPGKRHVLHKRRCNGGSGDNGCINIRHLRLGTNAENIQDKLAAGRSNYGERNGQAILANDDVRQIRRRHFRGAYWPHPGSSRALAAEFGVSPSTITDIVRRDRWGKLD